MTTARKGLYVSLLAVGIVLFLAGTSSAEEPSTPDGLPPGPPVVDPSDTAAELPAILDFRVAGSVLRPRRSGVDWVPTSDGGCFYVSAGDSFTVWNTALTDLPQGSNILAMRMYYDDTSASDSRAWFSVYDLYGNLVDEWSVDSVGSTGTGFDDTGVIDHQIDYLSYSYVINWRPYDTGSDMQLCGFRIFYEPS